MALSHLFQDLDPKISEALEETTRRLRAEFDQKLDHVRSELGGDASAASAAGAPAAEASSQSADAVEAARAAVADLLDPLEELKQAIVQVDTSGSQAEILKALLNGASRFSSRAAVFLLRGENVQAWGAEGFEHSADRIQGVQLSDESIWARLSASPGAIPLGADECKSVCHELGGEEPEVGLLLPFVLGDQVAAAVYCDRTAAGEPLNVSALQVLTFVSSQMLENLPVRQRDSTATLRLAEGASSAAADEDSSSKDGQDEIAAGLAGVGGMAALGVESEGVTQTVSEPPPALESEVPVDTQTAGLDVDSSSSSAVVEEPTPDTTELPPVEPAVTYEGDLSVPDRVEEASAEAPSVPPVPDVEPVSPDLPAVDEDLIATPAVSAVPAAPVEPIETIDEPVEQGLFEPEPPSQPVPEPVVPSPVVSEAAPPLSPPPAVPTAPADTPLPESGGTSTQVSAPDDVQGPGWAFTTTKVATEAGDDSRHEEARRLARLLVTEIKLYNEETVEKGREENNIYRLLREDIDRSRQIFEDRIDNEVRSTNDYFHEALVRILAGGDAAVLGA